MRQSKNPADETLTNSSTVNSVPGFDPRLRTGHQEVAGFRNPGCARVGPSLVLTSPDHSAAIDREISIVEKEVVEAAEAMPEDKFDFSPEKLNVAGSDYKGVRTFAEQLKHVAASNYLIWSPITGDKLPDTVNEGKGPENMKAKTDIIKFLKDSFAFGHKAVAALNGSNLVQPIPRKDGKTTTRLFLSTFAAAHAFDHYGQMVEYLRMNGIVPPASRGQ